MDKIYQTRFERRGGNCMAACIASMLHLELATIPDFWEGVPPDSENEWWCNLRNYLKDIGYSYCEIEFPLESKTVVFTPQKNARYFHSKIPTTRRWFSRRGRDGLVRKRKILV